VKRPAPVKTDNFFLLLFRSLRQQRVPIPLRIACHSLLLVCAALVIYALVMGLQFKQAMQQQADALGQSLIQQTATSATDLLVANDLVSLNVLLNNLVKNPLVAHAAIYSVGGDGRVLAEAGVRPSHGVLGDAPGLHSMDITFQDVIAGHLRLSLDMRQFRQPMTISLQSMGILSAILLALALVLSMRLGRHLSIPLMQLRVWMRDPDDPAPGAGRQDEIGDLARQLQARLVPARSAEPAQDDDFDADEIDDEDLEHDYPSRTVPRATPRITPATASGTAQRTEPRVQPRFDSSPFSAIEAPHDTPLDEAEAFDEDDLPFDIDEPDMAPAPTPDVTAPGRSAVLAVQLGAQEQLRRLPRVRLMNLLQRYRACLDQAATLYQAELHTLNDGSSLMLFHSQDSGEDYLTHALCCGELLRALGHALQIEVADSGITLQLQLGLTQGEDLTELAQGDLLLSDAAQDALALSQHSRNLLLIERSTSDDPLLRQRAKIRSIVSPEGASCVERLLDPYPALLERQLARMHERSNQS
jgi:uncharacterized membrane protein affecting hemolysin expression